MDSSYLITIRAEPIQLLAIFPVGGMRMPFQKEVVMFRRKLLALAAAATTTIGISMVAGITPALADTICSGPSYVFTPDDGLAPVTMHDHALNSPLTDTTSSTLQSFELCDAQKWTFNGVTHTVYEVQLAAHDQCADDNLANGGFVNAEACPGGFDSTQLWWFKPDGGCGSGPDLSGCYWIINVGGTDRDPGFIQYLDSGSYMNGEKIYCDTPPTSQGTIRWNISDEIH